MRTKAFESMIVAATANYPHNPINGIGQIAGITKVETKKRRTKKVGANSVVSVAEFGGKQYVAVGQFEVQLQDDNVLMTVCWDGQKLSFHYFGITQDETSSDCINEQYELALIMRTLKQK